MFMILKKKQMVATTLVIMLGIAGYLNYRYDMDSDTVASKELSKEEPGIGETVMVNAPLKTENKETDAFSVRRLERDKARDKTYDELKKILADETISQETRTETENKLQQIIAFEENEVTAQNMLSSKGFSETLVHITEEGVTVSIKQKGLSRSDTAKIVDVIYELTQNNNIKIVEVN